MSSLSADPQVLFVSEEKIKSFTTMNWNISPDEFVPYVYNAQNIYVSEYIGGSYYEDLKTKIANDTLTIADINLLDGYLGVVVLNWALYMALPFLQYKIYNKGVLSDNSENSTNVSLKELNYLREEVKSIAQNYTRRMQQFIQQRLDSYPLYASPDTSDGQLPSKGNPYDSGIVTFGNRINCYGR